MARWKTVLWCASLLLSIITIDAALSGLYIDNGIDQTIIHHSMTRHERQVVEHEILELLGLGERPRRSQAPPLDRSAPSFLLDVYKQLAEEHEQARPTRSSEMALSGEEQHAIDESDLIMTFQSKSKCFHKTSKTFNFSSKTFNNKGRLCLLCLHYTGTFIFINAEFANICALSIFSECYLRKVLSVVMYYCKFYFVQ